jgi:hypothetical protein
MLEFIIILFWTTLLIGSVAVNVDYYDRNKTKGTKY